MSPSLRVLTPTRSRVPGRGRVLLSRALPVLLLLAAVGCKTGIPAETYCYQMTGTAVHVVDTGMSIAGDLYRQGKLTEAQKAKLVAAHDVYRPAAKTAVAACKAVSSQADADKVFFQLQKAADALLETLVACGVIR